MYRVRFEIAPSEYHLRLRKFAHPEVLVYDRAL
jgi:hypothetical protein